MGDRLGTPGAVVINTFFAPSLLEQQPSVYFALFPCSPVTNPCACFACTAIITKVLMPQFEPFSRQRPYHVENTSSRPITEVKQRWARLVLGWVTAWEHRVLLSSTLFSLPYFRTVHTLAIMVSFVLFVGISHQII